MCDGLLPRHDEEEGSVRLVDYLSVLLRRWVFIALGTVVCAGAAVGFLLMQTPVSEAKTRLVVTGAQADSAVEETAQRNLAVQRATTYGPFAATPSVVDEALEAAGEAAAGGRPEVSAQGQPGTPFLTMTVADTDLQRAAPVVNTYAEKLPAAVARLERRDVSASHLTAAAAVPGAPARPRPAGNRATGPELSLMLGVGSAFLREAVDRRSNNAEPLKQNIGLTVLGAVPQEHSDVPLPTLTEPTSGRAEAYRTIRSNAEFAAPPHTRRTILITSAKGGEGKTSFSTSLAVALAASGQSVVLGDTDLRRRRVAQTFGLAEEGLGRAGVLAGSAPLERSLRTGKNKDLSPLPGVSSPDNPSELLGGPRTVELLKEPGERLEVVLVNSPPLLAVTDPLVLAVHATGVVVVVRLGETSRERLGQAITSLQNLDVPLLSLTANGAVATRDPAYGYADGDKPGRAQNGGKA